MEGFTDRISLHRIIHETYPDPSKIDSILDNPVNIKHKYFCYDSMINPTSREQDWFWTHILGRIVNGTLSPKLVENLKNNALDLLLSKNINLNIIKNILGHSFTITREDIVDHGLHMKDCHTNRFKYIMEHCDERAKAIIIAECFRHQHLNLIGTIVDYDKPIELKYDQDGNYLCDISLKELEPKIDFYLNVKKYGFKYKSGIFGEIIRLLDKSSMVDLDLEHTTLYHLRSYLEENAIYGKDISSLVDKLKKLK